MTRPTLAPARSVRVPNELWDSALTKAAEEDVKVSDILRDALIGFIAGNDPGGDDGSCTDCGGDHTHAGLVIDEFCEHDEERPPLTEDDVESDDRVATITGSGSLSKSEDPETQAAVLRVQELLREGAVGVSVMLDLAPDQMPSPELIKKLQDEGRWDELEELMSKVQKRIRHLAIVDTAAFADAHLVLGENGFDVAGPLVFEGPWTGDMRFIPYGNLDIDGSPTPIPILWDREDGDHSGMTVGSIDTLTRMEGDQRAVAAAAHAFTPDVTAEDVQAVTAAAGPTGVFPARFFEEFETKGVTPFHVDQPDPVTGLRRVWGTVAPKGVCHRSDMGACFKFPGDVDKTHAGFHTGAAITLDNGKTMRMGAITSGGLHVDTLLSKKGVGWKEANRHREDSSQVLAMGRAWADKNGHLQFSGVLAADVSPKRLLQALACAPSVELWPKGHGRTLTGIHMVPTPAWPVVASAGESMLMSSPIPVEIADAEAVMAEAEAIVAAAASNPKTSMGTVTVNLDASSLEAFGSRLDRIETALGLLVAERIADGILDVPDPDAD